MKKSWIIVIIILVAGICAGISIKNRIDTVKMNEKINELNEEELNGLVDSLDDEVENIVNKNNEIVLPDNKVESSDEEVIDNSKIGFWETNEDEMYDVKINKIEGNKVYFDWGVFRIAQFDNLVGTIANNKVTTMIKK